MDVQIIFDGRYWKTSPDPVEVKVGEPLRWMISGVNCPFPHLRWTIYFYKGAPFAPWQTAFATLTHAVDKEGKLTEQGGDHKGEIKSPESQNPGEFKYGVKVENADDGVTLGDDDPKLIVKAKLSSSGK